MANAACDGVLDHDDWVRIYGEVVQEVKAELYAQGRADALWDAKIIYSTVRFIDNDALREALEDCLALKAQFPDLIKGACADVWPAFGCRYQA
jgi:adenosine deaminase CECR1